MTPAPALSHPKPVIFPAETPDVVGQKQQSHGAHLQNPSAQRSGCFHCWKRNKGTLASSGVESAHGKQDVSTVSSSLSKITAAHLGGWGEV